MLSALFIPSLLALSSPLEIHIGLTAEWLAHSSDLVALATPLEAVSRQGSNGIWYTRTRFRLNEVLKGPESDDDIVTVFAYDYEAPDRLGLQGAARRELSLLIFCAVSRGGHGPELEGKYAFTKGHRSTSAYFVGAPVADLYTPRFALLGEYRELLGRARNQIARQAWIARIYHHVDVVRRNLEVPMGSEAHSKLYGGSGCYLWTPEYRTAEGEAFLTTESARGRSPATFSLGDRAASLALLKLGVRAFGNRRYAWRNVPERLRGWTFTRTSGGVREAVELEVDVGGHVYVAVEAGAIVEMKNLGWTLEGLDAHSTFNYSDHLNTRMVVFSKDIPTGARVQVPQVGWAGTLVLVPPPELR